MLHTVAQYAVTLVGMFCLALLLFGLAFLLRWSMDRAGIELWPAPRAVAPPDLLSSLVKKRYVVTLRSGEGDFAGILVEQQIVATPDGRPDLLLVFEHCATMPTHDGDTAADIAGRVILGMSGIAYLQQVG